MVSILNKMCNNKLQKVRRIMKYNGREVEDFTIGVELGKDKVCETLEEFKANEKSVANTLRQNDVDGWEYTEAPVDDLVLIVPADNTLEAANRLFCDVKRLFDNAHIAVMYTDFDENSHNQEEYTECLDVSLFEE